MSKINAYICRDGHRTVTVDLVEGVTPMMIRCKQRHEDGKHDCTERAMSVWYRCDQSLTPEYEWYKPTNLKKLSPDEREHVKQGGLMLRKIKRP